jgi:rhamnosyl/mannosyltransferase
MRVLQVGKYYHPYSGGIESHMRLLCEELKASVQLDVVVCNSKRRSAHDVVDGVRVTRCYEVAKAASTSICPTMPLELSRRQYDIIHFHFPHPMGVMSYLASVRPRPHAVVVTYHSDIIRQRRLLRAYAPFMHAVLRRADAIICATPHHIETSEVLQRYRSRCDVIPFGLDRGPFERTNAIDAEAAAIRARYGGGPLVLAVGRLIYYKGFEHLVRAMRGVAAHLLVIGAGPLRDPLERLARECNVADRVHLLGEVSGHLAPYYHACDVFALPSVERSEAFGIVQLEAMASGKPVVNTALDSGVPYVSRHEESGLTVPPANSDALVAALNRLLRDPVWARSLGDAGRARVAREFSKEVMREQTLRLYARVTSHGINGTRSV